MILRQRSPNSRWISSADGTPAENHEGCDMGRIVLSHADLANRLEFVNRTGLYEQMECLPLTRSHSNGLLQTRHPILATRTLWFASQTQL